MPQQAASTPSSPLDPDFVKRTLEAFPEEGVCDADQALVSLLFDNGGAAVGLIYADMRPDRYGCDICTHCNIFC